MPASRPRSPIHEVLELRGIRHEWLARQLGVSPFMFNHIEAGRRRAPAGYYERAAQVLGVPEHLLRPPPQPEPEPDAVA